MGFLYFLPAIQPVDVTPQVIREKGLEYALDGPMLKSSVEKGPGGLSGTIVARGKDADQVQFREGGQEWVKFAGYWVGRWIGARISPDDLARSEQIAGHPVVLDDGQAWLCPIARAWAEEDGELRWIKTLPRRMALKEGKWEAGDVVPRFARLWELAERFENVFYGAPVEPGEAAEGEVIKIEFDFSDATAAAVEVLGVNYRIGLVEASLLGILTDRNVPRILQALIDWPTRMEWFKKKALTAPDIGNTADGAGA